MPKAIVRTTRLQVVSHCLGLKSHADCTHILKNLGSHSSMMQNNVSVALNLSLLNSVFRNSLTRSKTIFWPGFPKDLLCCSTQLHSLFSPVTIHLYLIYILQVWNKYFLTLSLWNAFFHCNLHIYFINSLSAPGMCPKMRYLLWLLFKNFTMSKLQFDTSCFPLLYRSDQCVQCAGVRTKSSNSYTDT